MYDSAGSTPQSSMSAAQQDYAYENIHWEKTQSWDIGVDAAFFNNRLDFSADYYYKKTCLLYTSPSPRDRTRSRMPSSA